MYIFGGRSEKASLGDLWVLDTGRAVWQWSALISFGDMPCPREFSSATVIGNSKILMYGGWDGSDCLSDLHVLDTLTGLEKIYSCWISTISTLWTLSHSD